MTKLYALGYRKRNQTTFHRITVPVNKNELKRIKKLYSSLSNSDLNFRNIPSNIIFKSKRVRR